MIDINQKKPYREGNHSLFSAEENGCKYEGNNPKRAATIRQYKVDGEVFSKSCSTQRCDWLFLDDTHSPDRLAFYVELKGSDIVHAIEQIENTVKEISPSIPTYTIYRRIIYKTGSHKIQESSVIKWKRKYYSKAIIKERKMSENI